MDDSRAPAAGHAYSGIVISGQSRNHLGDQIEINHYHDGPRNERMKQEIVRSLEFEGQGQRSRDLPRAGRNPYNWILEADCRDPGEGPHPKGQSLIAWVEKTRPDGYERWMREGLRRGNSNRDLRKWFATKAPEGIFWITGKPGSGKSTLMKAITHHRALDDLLSEWACGDDYIVVEHFFWIAGMPMQRSLAGLYQALLHGVLSQLKVENDLELIKMVCGSRWDTRRSGRAWGPDEAREALRRACFSRATRIVLLIDGLDECATQHHNDLMSDLVGFSASEAIKIIVSSRPWPNFQRKLRNAPQLRLEDLNLMDMSEYVEKELAEAEAVGQGSRDFGIRTDDALSVIYHVSHKAEGVFYWTTLVIKALVDEAHKGKPTGSLLQLVEHYPEDLGHYFREQIYGRVSKAPRNKIDTANALKLMLLITKHGLPAYAGGTLVAFFLLRDDQLTQSLQDTQMPWYSKSQAVQYRQSTRSFLWATCGDMLQIKIDDEAPLSSAVEYVHRTAFDFLHEDENANFIEANCTAILKEEDFIESFSFACLSTVMRQEFLPCRFVASMFDHFCHETEVHKALHTSSRLTCESLVIQQLARFCSCRPLVPAIVIFQHWNWHVSRACITSNLEQYPLAAMGAWSVFATSNQALMDHLKLWLGLTGAPIWKSRPSVVQRLLDFGPDPNVPFAASHCNTVWEAFVRTCVRSDSMAPRDKKMTARLMLVLLESGADPHWAPCIDGTHRSRSVACNRVPLTQVIKSYVPARWQSALLAKVELVSQPPAREYRSRRQRLRALRAMRSWDYCSHGKDGDFVIAWLPRLKQSGNCCDRCGMVFERMVGLCLDCVGTIMLCEDCAYHHQSDHSQHYGVGLVFTHTPSERPLPWVRLTNVVDVIRGLENWYERHAEAHGIVGADQHREGQSEDREKRYGRYEMEYNLESTDLYGHWSSSRYNMDKSSED